MKVVKMPLEKLKRPEKNVRIHGDRQIAEFIRSIRMFGQIRPIILDDEYSILAGNGLFEALSQMGATEADCYVIPGLTSAQKKKLMLADNRIFSLGVDDMNAFDEIIAELGNDYDIPGFDVDLIKTLMASDETIDNMVTGYGVFSDESRREMQRNAEAQESNPTDSDTASQARESPLQPSEQYAPITQYTANESEESRLQPQSGTFVVCPKCGERIYL